MSGSTCISRAHLGRLNLPSFSVLKQVIGESQGSGGSTVMLDLINLTTMAKDYH